MAKDCQLEKIVLNLENNSMSFMTCLFLSSILAHILYYDVSHS